MSGYEFSQLYHSSIVVYSPGTTFIATAHQNRVIVRSTTTLQIVRTWLCAPKSPIASSSKAPSEFNIEILQWSEDGSYVLAMARGSVWVFALAEEGRGDSGEVARIDEGVEGCVRAEWGRGSRDVLVWSDYGVKLTIHDLCTGMARIIQYPKSPNNCHAYSSDSRYLAVVERHSGKDTMGIYDVGLGYQLLRHFAIDTVDIHSLAWSPCGRYLAAVDSALSYSLYIYSPLGPCLTHFSPVSPTFALAAGEDPGLGIRLITWGPGGRWIALGGWDNRVRIIESEGWRCVALMSWGSRINDKAVAVWREPSDWIQDTRGRGIVQFDRVSAPAAIPAIRVDHTKYPARTGISQIAFDFQGSLFCVRSDLTPNVIHIHTFLTEASACTPQITHLTSGIFANPVKSAKWVSGMNKTKRLVIATRTGAVYLWDGESGWLEDGEEAEGGMMEGIGIPARTDFAAHDIVCSPEGSSVAILDKHQFCMLYETEGDETIDGRAWEVSEGEGLSHVMEEEEDWEASQASFLSSNLDAVLA